MRSKTPLLLVKLYRQILELNLTGRLNSFSLAASRWILLLIWCWGREAPRRSCCVRTDTQWWSDFSAWVLCHIHAIFKSFEVVSTRCLKRLCCRYFLHSCLNFILKWFTHSDSSVSMKQCISNFLPSFLDMFITENWKNHPYSLLTLSPFSYKSVNFL